VHDLLLRGFSNREIVEALDISLPTAKQYKSEVMRKLGARSLAELMALSAATPVKDDLSRTG
jgi:DNA-binding NarL/FixJ family response regulator